MAKKDLSKLKDQADKLFRKGKLEKALQSYEELEKLSKGDVRYAQKTAEILARMDKKSEAVEKYKDCIDKYLEKGFLVQAIALAKVILDIDPDDQDAKKRLEEMMEKRQSKEAKFPVAKKKKKPREDDLKKEEPDEQKPEEPADEEPAAEEEAAGDAVPAGPEQDYGMLDLSSEQEPAVDAEDALDHLEDKGAVGVEADDSGLHEEEDFYILLFSDLKPEEFGRVFDVLRSVTIPPGVAICREGDKGDSIFIIAEGSVKVTRKGPEGQEIYLADLGPGDFFGEFGYFANSIRQATVKTETKTQLLEMSREDMDKVAEEFPRVKEVMLKFYKDRVLDNMLAMSPLFQQIGQRERLKLIEKFELREIEPGEVIVKEGDMGESMYLIKSGRVEVTTVNPIDKSRTVLAQLESGEFFGEVSLVKQRPRTASVAALTPVEIMEITRDAFEEIANERPEMKQILEETIEKRVEATIEKVTGKLKTAV
jgi:CRP-like cAMP-binding protein